MSFREQIARLRRDHRTESSRLDKKIDSLNARVDADLGAIQQNFSRMDQNFSQVQEQLTQTQEHLRKERKEKKCPQTLINLECRL